MANEEDERAFALDEDEDIINSHTELEQTVEPSPFADRVDEARRYAEKNPTSGNAMMDTWAAEDKMGPLGTLPKPQSAVSFEDSLAPETAAAGATETAAAGATGAAAGATETAAAGATGAAAGATETAAGVGLGVAGAEVAKTLGKAAWQSTQNTQGSISQFMPAPSGGGQQDPMPQAMLQAMQQIGNIRSRM